METYSDIFKRIISQENLFSAWEEFRKGKQHKLDVQRFEFDLERNVFQLHWDLKDKTYKHGPYEGFYIREPKVRNIHKATVRDRVLHHAIFKMLNPLFEPTFIPHSFSCRIGKGTHKGVLAVEQMLRKESRNYTDPCFVLKCDVKKFFDTVNHSVLLEILSKRIIDQDALWLLKEIIGSYATGYVNLLERKGLPIGNLTSQFFANIYMNEFDQFVKHTLKINSYARYTDDFVIISKDREYLRKLVSQIRGFLKNQLSLELHPRKIGIWKFHQGIDFLGCVALPHYRVLRMNTRRRIFRKVKERVGQYRNAMINNDKLNQSLQSYLGVLSHANAYELSEELKNQFWFWFNEK